jgi:hypothetical protein
MPWIEPESGPGDRVGSGVDGICVGSLSKLHADRNMPSANPNKARIMPFDTPCRMLKLSDPRR